MKHHLFWLLLIACAICTQAESSDESLRDKILGKLRIFDIWYSNFWNHSTSNTQLQSRNESLQYLDRTIIKNLHPIQGRCELPRAFVCDSYWFDWTRPTEENLVKKPLKKRFYKIFNDVKDLLNKTTTKYDSKALSIEKQLYQDCMATEDFAVTLENQNIVELAFKDFIHNASTKSWQMIDKELAEMGFGHAFFHISITSHPDNPGQKIILLEPLTFTVGAFDSYEVLEKVMNSLKINAEQKEDFELAMHFYTALKKSTRQKIIIEKMTIPKWYEFYLEQTNGQGSQSSEIFWFEIFQSILNKYKMTQIDTSHILVKNKQYFHHFEKLLRLFSNKKSRIVNLLAVKWIIDNLKYISRNAWNSLHNQDKSSYCMRQTKLYGASDQALHSYKESNNLELLIKVMKDMINHIVRAIQVDITVADSNKENKHLIQYMRDITTLLLHDDLHRSLIDEFYGDLHLTHNYHDDIINYHKTITKAFSDMKFKDGFRFNLPFSIVDLDRPENRIVLRAYLSSSDLVLPTLHKEYHYGGYGAMMTRFLYDLVKNKKFEAKESYVEDFDWLFTRARFPRNVTQCFPHSSLKTDEVDAYVSEILGLRTAYEAMMQHYLQSNDVRKVFTFEDSTYSEDAMFILSFLKHRCYYTEEMAQTVLNNFDPFPSAFNCQRNVKSSRCSFEAL